MSPIAWKTSRVWQDTLNRNHLCEYEMGHFYEDCKAEILYNTHETRNLFKAKINTTMRINGDSKGNCVDIIILIYINSWTV